MKKTVAASTFKNYMTCSRRVRARGALGHRRGRPPRDIRPFKTSKRTRYITDAEFE